MPCKRQGLHRSFAKTKPYVRRVGVEPSDPQHDYAFSINEGDHSELYTVRICGVDLKMLTDYGANSNINDEGP